MQLLCNRLSGLLRTRVLLSCLGLYVMYKQPSIGQWVVAIVGLALGVSAVDAWKGTGPIYRAKDDDNG
jgi:hypothetical protein